MNTPIAHSSNQIRFPNPSEPPNLIPGNPGTSASIAPTPTGEITSENHSITTNPPKSCLPTVSRDASFNFKRSILLGVAVLSIIWIAVFLKPLCNQCLLDIYRKNQSRRRCTPCDSESSTEYHINVLSGLFTQMLGLFAVLYSNKVGCVFYMTFFTWWTMRLVSNHREYDYNLFITSGRLSANIAWVLLYFFFVNGMLGAFLWHLGIRRWEVIETEERQAEALAWQANQSRASYSRQFWRLLYRMCRARTCATDGRTTTASGDQYVRPCSV